MELKVTKITEHPSKHGGCFYYIFFKNLEDGKSYKTCANPEYRNYGYWKPVIRAFNSDKKVDVIVRGTRVKKGNLLDADVMPKVSVKEVE